MLVEPIPDTTLDISVDRYLAAKGIPGTQERVAAWRTNIARLGLTEGEGFHVVPVYLCTKNGLHYRVWLSTAPATYGAIEGIEIFGLPKPVSRHPWYSATWAGDLWRACERDALTHHAETLATVLAERVLA